MAWTLDLDDVPPLWRHSEPPAHAVLAATTRRGGVSQPPFDSLNLGNSVRDAPEAVRENRRRVLRRLSLDPERVAVPGQVHGAGVLPVTEAGVYPGADALVTRVPGLALAIATADCLPLLYVAPGAVAAAHAGWRGVLSGMPGAALDAVCALSDVTPADVSVYIGPAIGPCCFRVGEEVAARFPSQTVTRDATGPRVALAEAARLQLLERGAIAALVAPPACTSCATDLCYSHRRDAGRTGRHWGVVALLP